MNIIRLSWKKKKKIKIIYGFPILQPFLASVKFTFELWTNFNPSAIIVQKVRTSYHRSKDIHDDFRPWSLFLTLFPSYFQRIFSTAMELEKPSTHLPLRAPQGIIRQSCPFFGIRIAISQSRRPTTDELSVQWAAGNFFRLRICYHTQPKPNPEPIPHFPHTNR